MPEDSDPHATQSDESRDELSVGLLEQLTPDTYDAIARAVHELRVPAGGEIFRQGDPGTSLYLVRSGLVDILVGDRGEMHRISTLGPGDTVGERSLLTGRCRSANAVAQTAATLWRLELTDFLEILARHSDLGVHVARVLSERMSTAAGTTRRNETVALCAPDPAVTARAAVGLVAECERLLGARPAVIAAGPAERWGGALPADCLVVAADEAAGVAVRAVRTNSLVLMLFGRDVPAEVVRGADRLVVLDGLALADQRDRPTFEADAPTDERSTAALARRVCGRTVGLALGAGAIRGLAHGGVLSALSAAQVPVDFVAGSSAGAIAGALYLTDNLAKFSSMLAGTIRSSVPRIGFSPQALLPGRPLRSFLRQRLGGTKIEDLSTPFTVVTTDLGTRKVRYIEHGSLADAVAASSAVPGLFPPVLIGESRLCDGGSTDPIPIGRLRERGADIVIAVNVMRLGGDLLGMQLPRVPLPVPKLVTNLFLGLDTLIAEISNQACKLADVAIEPVIDNPRWYAPIPMGAYRTAGITAAEAAIPKIRDLVGLAVPA
jgi:NTE family protein